METSTETYNNDEIKIIKSWDEYNLKHELMRGIYAYGFENPSEIQGDCHAKVEYFAFYGTRG